MNKQKNSFSHLFSNHNLEKDNQIRKYNTIIQNQNIKEDISSEKSGEIKCDDFDKNYVDMETFKIFTTKIENLLKNIIISDIDEYNKNENKSLTIDLLKKGFSKTIISDFQKKISKDKEIT